MKLVLASGSPQRAEILRRLGVEFEVVVSGVEEVAGGDPAADVLTNARLKARATASLLAERGSAGAVAADGRDALIVGCDTDVVHGGRILGKPADRDEARRYLAALAGRVHEVVSGLVLLDTAVAGAGEVTDPATAGPGERHGLARSEVSFRPLDAAEIEAYLETGEWAGRAGGYAIQGWGATLVAAVTGDVTNVIGLPVPVLWQLAPELRG